MITHDGGFRRLLILLPSSEELQVDNVCLLTPPASRRGLPIDAACQMTLPAGGTSLVQIMETWGIRGGFDDNDGLAIERNLQRLRCRRECNGGAEFSSGLAI